MKEPTRWLHQEGAASSEVRELLEVAKPSRLMTDTELARSTAQIAKIAAMPAGGSAVAPIVKKLLGILFGVGGGGAIVGGLLWLQSDADPRVVDNIATKPGSAVPIPALSASTEVVERSSPDWPTPVVSVPDGSASDGSAPDGLAPFDVSASAVATVHSVQASDSIPTRGRQLRVAAKTPKSEPSAALTKAAVPEAMASSLPSTSSPAYPPPPPDTLGAEFEMLREARKLLATNPRSALDWLEEHQRSYPDGKLEFQREILVIDALVAMDRVSEAAKRAEALQERVRGTPYETRLAKMIADVWGF